MKRPAEYVDEPGTSIVIVACVLTLAWAGFEMILEGFFR
jgi:hypothetical protein